MPETPASFHSDAMRFALPGARTRSVWFGPSSNPLFGRLTSPARAARGAVVICPPIGREHSSSYPTFVQLAERLALANFVVLRFNYHSTGDSTDASDASSGQATLLSDVREAVGFVRGLGLEDVSLVGMRTGALLAGLSARERRTKAVVMWDPCESGRAYIREQKILGMAIPPVSDASEPDDVPAFFLSSRLKKELMSLSIEPDVDILADHVLLMFRDDRNAPKSLAAASFVPQADRRQVQGQRELLDLPTPMQVIPVNSITMIVDWLRKKSLSSPLRLIPDIDEITKEAGVGTWLASDSDSDTMVPIVEQEFRSIRSRVFGIETRPASGETTGPPILFVNVATEHRIGPSRMWVELARKLAARGFRCIRIDVGRTGDSAGLDEELAPLWSSDRVRDVVDAATTASPDDPADVVLVGLCASGYDILEAGAHLRVRGVCTINPSLQFNLPEGESEILQIGWDGQPIERRFHTPKSAASALSERVMTMTWLEERLPPIRRLGSRFPVATMRLRVMAKKAVGMVNPVHHPADGGHRTAQHLVDMAEEGTNLLLISNKDEPRPFELALSLAKGKDLTGRLQVELLRDLDHAVRRREDRKAVTSIIIDHLIDTYSSPRRQRPQPVARG